MRESTMIEAEKFFEELRKCEAPDCENDGVHVEHQLTFSGRDFMEIADKDDIQWIVTDRLEDGGLTIFSGKPYSGKSVVVSHLIGCCLEGKPFFGVPVQQSHVLYIDTDRNRVRRTRDRIQRVASADAICKYFAYANVDALPDALTDSAIRGAMNHAITNFGVKVERLLVVIDTFRSAFLSGLEKGSESDSVAMVKVLKPIKRLSRDTNATFLILHHDPKYSGEIAGSGAIPGVTDAVWGYGGDSEARTLNVKTRDDKKIAPMQFTYDADNGLRQYDPDADPEIRKKKEREERELIENICSHFPSKANEALGMEQIKALPCFANVTRSTIQDRLTMCERPGVHPRLVRLGEGKKGDCYRWYTV